MRRGKSILVIVSGILIGLGIAALGLRLYLGRAAESRLRPDEIVDFAARNSAGRGNVFAMCPARFCTPEPDRESPVFAMRWERLRDYWREVTAVQPRLEQVADDDSHCRQVFVQRSAVLRFPDIVTVEFVALGDERSSLAIDSRSRYGRSDLGVNRRRVTAWMMLLEQIIGQDRPHAAAADRRASAS